MTPNDFVNALSQVKLDNVFNPYSDICAVNDRPDAASARRRNLQGYLKAALTIGIDTIWMGRDLGYRGGRRTGIALTDEFHLPEMTQRYPGTNFKRATLGPAISERTASEIWSVLRSLALPPLLWNVFPFHPHEPDNPFSNRKFTVRELLLVEELNEILISWLKIRRIVAIGQDASQYARRFGLEVITIRHPSYGGINDFRNGMSELYGIPPQNFDRKKDQGLLF
ncbi:hypothetical protein DR66_3978 [Delftia acidovorans]|uniref:uracil-DNA glycosylase n=1 Tax=Delftia acidovorans TaxID=80866 RepID=UPI0004FFA62D|nr:uracil-DNA glycosylase [Delftia acidovorans]KFJ12955.1 hypothetical protein DR66_3978 [Delftia acidovorans]QQB53327.1 uracil-DNA glycosylase [Delftia acidovorans]